MRQKRAHRLRVGVRSACASDPREQSVEPKTQPERADIGTNSKPPLNEPKDVQLFILGIFERYIVSLTDKARFIDVVPLGNLFIPRELWQHRKQH